MSGKYPVTATQCQTCTELDQALTIPPITATRFQDVPLDPSRYPVHNWYLFTLSFSPKFVDYEIDKKKIEAEDRVLDPFLGTGTTAVECKSRGIKSVGVEANDFLSFAAQVKTNWDIPVDEIRGYYEDVDRVATVELRKYRWSKSDSSLIEYIPKDSVLGDLNIRRPELLKDRYISDKPLAKLLVLKRAIGEVRNEQVRNLFRLALASVAIPSSNVRFGPQDGLIKPMDDVDVLRLFRSKISRMMSDLTDVRHMAGVEARCLIGDSRELTKTLANVPIKHVITSPPYPADHDYTRYTRIGLALLDFVRTIQDVREIKKRMVRGSTRNVFSTDEDRKMVERFVEIRELMARIEKRVKDTNGTSGFEKLYAKLVGEYFGGMYRSLAELYELLERGATLSFLVGDTHSFKMVHIQTAKILGELAMDIGYRKYDIQLWQNTRSTAHNYRIPENVLEVYK